tara:strand:- start:279 stop:476 length:198 start_codon:yes stop_codon:yes gene_type:complete
MGRVNDWVIGMQEDAAWMSRDSWAAKHGAENLDLYDRTQREMNGFEQPDGQPDEAQEWHDFDPEC